MCFDRWLLVFGFVLPSLAFGQSTGGLPALRDELVAEANARQAADDAEAAARSAADAQLASLVAAQQKTLGRQSWSYQSGHTVQGCGNVRAGQEMPFQHREVGTVAITFQTNARGIDAATPGYFKIKWRQWNGWVLDPDPLHQDWAGDLPCRAVVQGDGVHPIQLTCWMTLPAGNLEFAVYACNVVLEDPSDENGFTYASMWAEGKP